MRIGIEMYDSGRDAVRLRRKPVHDCAMDHIVGSGVREQHARARIRQHEGEPLLRVVGIERQIGAARLEDAEEPHDHVEGAGKAQPHYRLRSHSQSTQMMRQPVGAQVQLAIGERLLLEHHRGRIRGLCRLCRKQRRQGGLRHAMGGVVPPAQDGLAFRSAEDVKASQDTLGCRNRSRNEPNEALRQRLHACPLEQVGCVFNRPHNPRRRTLPVALLAQAQRQVELGARGRNRLKPAVKPSHLKARARIVLERQHHLEQRMMRQRARRVEHLNQPLERHLLVTVGRQVARAHPQDQIAQAGIARTVRPQHQRVDEEAHQIVERAVGAPGNGAANGDVAARPQAREQPGKAGLQHHEQARPTRARKRHEPAMQFARERNLHHRTAMARHRRPGPIGGKLNGIGKPGQIFAPEAKLAHKGALRLALLPQRIALPQRVIGILHRQWRKLRRLPLPPRRIAARNIAPQRRQ